MLQLEAQRISSTLEPESYRLVSVALVRCKLQRYSVIRSYCKFRGVWQRGRNRALWSVTVVHWSGGVRLVRD